MSLNSEEKQSLIASSARHPTDTGSPEVQCTVLTTRIRALTEHMKLNPKDFQSRRGVIAMVNKRKKLMRYLKNEDNSRYVEMTDKLQLKRK